MKLAIEDLKATADQARGATMFEVKPLIEALVDKLIRVINLQSEEIKKLQDRQTDNNKRAFQLEEDINEIYQLIGKGGRNE